MVISNILFYKMKGILSIVYVFRNSKISFGVLYKWNYAILPLVQVCTTLEMPFCRLYKWKKDILSIVHIFKNWNITFSGLYKWMNAILPLVQAEKRLLTNFIGRRNLFYKLYILLQVQKSCSSSYNLVQVVTCKSHQR